MHANPKTKRRIHCSEEDADSRSLIVFVLTREGYDVTATENSTDALALVNWMPGLSGPDLTRQVQEFNTTTPNLFTPERRRNLTSKRPAMPAPRLYHKPLEISGLVHEVATLIAEAKIASRRDSLTVTLPTLVQNAFSCISQTLIHSLSVLGRRRKASAAVL